MHDDLLEPLLHIPCTVVPYEDAAHLPLYLRGSYDFYEIKTEHTTFLAAQPIENIPLPTLRKHWAALTKQSGLTCAFYFDTLQPYKKEKLVEGGIPFILGTTEVFLPFLGVALSAQARELPEKKLECSMLTQKFLLIAIYQQIRSASAAQMANLLGVSRMSGTRCMDEVEGLFPTLIQKNGRRRVFAWDGEWKAYWILIRPSLRNPVVREYRLDEPLNLSLPFSGISAVCHYSMLDEGHTRVYGMTKKMAADRKLSTQPQVPSDEIPVAIVQVLGYELPFQNYNAVDPLTAILSLTPEEQKDPRVEGAIQEIEANYLP
ncbi:hypothetical protein [Pseudoflavonifractor sp. MSJ-37]|uniref:hypothetical protein n=1 Tax=Pseudoflavonifractor sp. MSJ-37 TaxID=2841531 RepID=UPI001C1294D7|nr:hypothetical protein [Pseudoflavonifractor sp. MSJ-37]MBU5435908.1 hypothetical protein [Pseudoflavonifractor sp. MSJ-37]